MLYRPAHCSEERQQSTRQADDEECQCRVERSRLDYRVVALPDRGECDLAEPWQVEDLLDQEGAPQHVSDLDTEHGDRLSQRISLDIVQNDPRSADAEAAGSQYVWLDGLLGDPDLHRSRDHARGEPVQGDPGRACSAQRRWCCVEVYVATSGNYS